jgi:hypothetical protein
MFSCDTAYSERPTASSASALLWKRLHVGDLAVAHRDEHRHPGNHFYVLTAHADNPNRDYHSVLVYRDELLRFAMLQLPHPAHD